MPDVHLVEGPVGAGKSTFCRSLCARVGGVHLALDAWFTRLFSPDRPQADVMPWYEQRKERLLMHLWDHTRALLAAGATPVLELGLIQRARRDAFHQRARDEGIVVRTYLVDAPREIRRERVARRNVAQGPTFSMVVPDAVFELASDLWEPPDALEIAAHRIERVSTGGDG